MTHTVRPQEQGSSLYAPTLILVEGKYGTTGRPKEKPQYRFPADGGPSYSNANMGVKKGHPISLCLSVCLSVSLFSYRCSTSSMIVERALRFFARPSRTSTDSLASQSTIWAACLTDSRTDSSLSETRQASAPPSSCS